MYIYICSWISRARPCRDETLRPCTHTRNRWNSRIKKKNVIKPTKFCPFKYTKFWHFLRGSSMKICPINVPNLFQISRWLGNLRWLPCHGSKHFRKYPRWCWTKCAKQNMYISTNAKYMDTGHRYNQTSKQREEHQEYQLDPRYLSS